MWAVQLRARSEDDADDELLSVAVVKNGNKAVTGSQMGVLSLYSWGYFSDCSDRFPGDSLLRYQECQPGLAIDAILCHADCWPVLSGATSCLQAASWFSVLQRRAS